MKKIPISQQRKIMIGILSFFDDLCRKNQINYSLIGGTLIGAIRHKGFIPWDDDIDVILTPDNYKRLCKVLIDLKNEKYMVLYPNKKTYYMPFIKLVDSRTSVVEPQLVDKIENYGVYLDIFRYVPTSNNAKNRLRHYKQMDLTRRMLSRKKIKKGDSLKRKISCSIRNIIVGLIGYRKILKVRSKIENKFSEQNAHYYFSNWCLYGHEKEIQSADDLREYIDTSFEGRKVMIFKNYDHILSTTFGNYMQLPPKEDRICHGLIAYWKKGYGPEEKN